MLAWLFAGCSKQERAREFKNWLEDNGKIKVLSTTAMIDDLVKGVGKERVDALTLIQGELDPHSYQLVKGDDEKLSFAQLIFFNGLGLEHGPSLKRHLENNAKAVPLGDRIELSNPSLILYVNDQRDPHIWMDISLWARTVPFIEESLSRIDPSNASYYKENAKQLQKEMAKAHDEVQRILHEIPPHKRYLVTSHDAFNYFTRAYLSEGNETATGEWKKRFAAPEGLAPESQLSALNIKDIIEYLKLHQVDLIFPESNVSRDSIRKIIQAGQEKGLEVKMACCPLYGDAMGKQGSDGDTYLKMIIHNARILADHMDGKGTIITEMPEH
jgi:manganese/zinc/iron transport system substrate-binding protein